MNTNSIWQPHQRKFRDQLNLKIDDPSLYHCVVRRYSQSHRELVVAVNKIANPETDFYLVFESVWYFQGGTSWQGIDFEFAEASERKALALKVFPNIEKDMFDGFAQQFTLYVIRNSKIDIQILASNCFTLKDISVS